MVVCYRLHFEDMSLFSARPRIQIHDSDPPILRKGLREAQRLETTAEHFEEISSSFSQFHHFIKQKEIRNDHDLAKLLKLSDVGVELRPRINASETNY